jgi:hypothetical protein
MGKGRMEKLCPTCAETLSALVRITGDSCQLSMFDERFVTWLETDNWTAKSGLKMNTEGLMANHHDGACSCCSVFAEED